jgi:serine/threonine-protein kinase
VKGKGAAIPPPTTLDDVMEEALAKNPNIRTKTVGALADAVGHAYGLTGDHKQWATVPQAELGRLCSEARPALMARGMGGPPPGVEADPFAAPSAFASTVVAGSPGSVAGGGAQRGSGAAGGLAVAPAGAMDQAFEVSKQADLAPLGVPTGRPAWVLPLVVGVAALLVGGGLALVFVLAR